MRLVTWRNANCFPRCISRRAGLLHKGTRILAIARNKADSSEVRKILLGKLKEHVKKVEFDAEVAEQFLRRVDYQFLDFTNPEGYSVLNDWRSKEPSNLIVYMATPPAMYGEISRNLREITVATRTPGWL